MAFPGLTLSYSWRFGRLEILEPNRLEHVALPPCGTSTGTRPDGTGRRRYAVARIRRQRRQDDEQCQPDNRYESGRQPGHRPLAPQNVHSDSSRCPSSHPPGGETLSRPQTSEGTDVSGFCLDIGGFSVKVFLRSRAAVCWGDASMKGLREQIANSTRSLRDVFRNPGLRRLQLAFAGSIVGDWAYAVAVAVYAYERGGPTAVGVLGVIRYVSLAVVTPFAATLGDRYSRRLVMVSSDLTRGVLVFCGAALIASGAPSLSVYALAVVTSLCGSPFRSAQASLIPDLADNAGELAASNVASSTIESVGFFAGPALAGLFLAFTSLSVVYVFDGLTFIWSAALVLGIHPSAREREAAAAPRERRAERRLHERGHGRVPHDPRLARPPPPDRPLLRPDHRGGRLARLRRRDRAQPARARPLRCGLPERDARDRGVHRRVRRAPARATRPACAQLRHRRALLGGSACSSSRRGRPSGPRSR